MQLVAFQQPDRLRPFLWADRFFADYAISDLDPAHFSFTEWFGAEEDGQLCAVVMLYHGLQPPIFFATGEARGIEYILQRMTRPARIELSIREEHLPIVEKLYQAYPVPMLKMALVPEDFRLECAPSVQAHSAKQSPAEKLDIAHLPLLEALYSNGGGDAFRRRSLELGVFYGVFEVQQLVSVAGTHIVSDQDQIAALGNVMTHPAYRGRGLATMATRAVCGELLERGIRMVGLSVGRTNEAAIRVYEKIGFRRRLPFYEGSAILRQPV